MYFRKFSDVLLTENDDSVKHRSMFWIRILFALLQISWNKAIN